MEMTQKVFCYISSEISNGRPVWGLLRANEYLEASNPIRQALVVKAKNGLTKFDLNQTQIQAFNLIAQGHKLADLSAELQAAVANIKESNKIQKRYIPTQPIRNVAVKAQRIVNAKRRFGG